MERQVVLDGRARLDSLHLEGGADVGERRGAEREGLGVMLLPSLVFGAQIKGPRVLEIRGENNGLVTSFSRELDTQVPGIERDEHEVEVLGRQVLGSEGIKAVDSVSEGAGVADMLPRQGCQARWWRVGQRWPVRREAQRALGENWS